MSKLGDLIYRDAKARERSEVEAITGGGRAEPNRGKFAAVCEGARADTAAAELNRARQLLIDEPKLLEGGPGAEGEFYSRFPRANLSELRTLVGKAKAVLHPPRTFDDIPEATPGEFVRKTRPF